MRSSNDPYFYSSIYDLENEVRSHESDLRTLISIFRELECRETPRAIRLRVKVELLIRSSEMGDMLLQFDKALRNLEAKLNGKSSSSILESYLSNPVIREWYDSSIETVNILDDHIISIVGDGSILERGEMSQLLLLLNARIEELSPQTDLIIVGSSGWEEATLEQFIWNKSGKSLRVYSQEMILFWFWSNKDPLSVESVARQFNDDHSALQFLTEFGFDWPTTQVTIGMNRLGNVWKYDQGMLKAFGYSVGKARLLSKNSRRDKLLQIYITELLPDINNRHYLGEWGEAKSCRRLEKIANTIASLARNAQRRQIRTGVDLSIAIEDWLDDLSWLHRKYFSTSPCGFRWPETEL